MDPYLIVLSSQKISSQYAVCVFFERIQWLNALINGRDVAVKKITDSFLIIFFWSRDYYDPRSYFVDNQTNISRENIKDKDRGRERKSLPSRSALQPCTYIITLKISARTLWIIIYMIPVGGRDTLRCRINYSSHIIMSRTRTCAIRVIIIIIIVIIIITLRSRVPATANNNPTMLPCINIACTPRRASCSTKLNRRRPKQKIGIHKKERYVTTGLVKLLSSHKYIGHMLSFYTNFKFS